jgi:hypothetical protein
MANSLFLSGSPKRVASKLFRIKLTGYFAKRTDLAMSSKNISEIDSNFLSKTIGDREIEFHNPTLGIFELSGLNWFDKDREFCRLPQNMASKINEGVTWLAWHTSGVQIRFKTNSNVIALSVELLGPGDMNHMPDTGSSGFDLYMGTGVEKQFIQNFGPANGEKIIEGISVESDSCQMREYTIYFPLYNGVKKVLVGIEPETKFEPPTPFTIEKPVVFYGSSITQGGCASRPGNAYTAFITRWCDANMLNFGFSGSGCGETNIAELLATIDASVFVIDYDHNAPNEKHLAKTHEPFFNILRKSHPDMPVVMVSRPDSSETPEGVARRKIIRQTYENARAEGDANVYFVDGITLFGKTDRDACTVDGCHPNDIGFLRMAEGIYPAVKQGLGT